jgi:hypothetical protein
VQTLKIPKSTAFATHLFNHQRQCMLARRETTLNTIHCLVNRESCTGHQQRDVTFRKCRA